MGTSIVTGRGKSIFQVAGDRCVHRPMGWCDHEGSGCLQDRFDSRRLFVFVSSRSRHTRFDCDWSSDVCSSDLKGIDQRSACRHPDWTGPDDLEIKIGELREITDWEKPIFVKVGATRTYYDVQLAVKAGEIGRASCRERG